jgi:hypothetical protein
VSDGEEYDNYPVMPTVFRGKDGAAIRTQSPVIHPDGMSKAERDMLTTTYNTCGQCKYFEKAEGEAQIKAQQFYERLVREDQWQIKHLALSPLNFPGICGEHSSGAGGDQMLTGAIVKACDHFTDAKGLITLRRKTTD